jgi:tyrosyl-tRNA synthetase
VFTFMPRAEIEEYERLVADEPFRRAAQKRLALEVTTLVHGAAAAQGAIDASSALFGQGDLAALDAATLEAAISELPQAAGGSGDSVAQLLVDSGLVPTLSEARRAIAQGGVYVNNEKVEAQDAALTDSDLLHGRFAVLRRGKKTLAGVTAP